MSRKPATDRRHTPTIGVILPDAMYTTEACMTQCGIGYDQLAQARRAGVVKAYGTRKQMYYLGSELIAWVKREVK